MTGVYQNLFKVCISLALAGCATKTITTTTTPPGSTTPVTTTTTVTTNPVQNLAQFTVGDLQNAIALATAAGTAPGQPGYTIVPCFTFLEGQVNALNSSGAAPAPGTAGLATAFTVADIAAYNVNNALSPAQQAAFDMACGPLVLQVQNQGMAFGAQIAALGGLLVK
jgi:hypothetical protein